MYYTTVTMGDRNYAGIADRFNRRGDWGVLAKLNNSRPVRVGAKIAIPDSWVRRVPAVWQGQVSGAPNRQVPPVWQGQVSGAPNRRVPAVWQGQVSGAPNRFQGTVTRRFGVGQESGGEVTQDQCMTAMEDQKDVGNPMYLNLVAKYGQESADKRWTMIGKAACYDKQYMIQIPWLKLGGAVALGALLGVGGTIATIKIME